MIIDTGATREKLITECKDLFYRTTQDFGRTKLIQHRIYRGNLSPIKKYQKILPFTKQIKGGFTYKKMQQNDIIEPLIRLFSVSYSCCLSTVRKIGAQDST